jgi:hypothetical protein
LIEFWGQCDKGHSFNLAEPLENSRIARIQAYFAKSILRALGRKRLAKNQVEPAIA